MARRTSTAWLALVALSLCCAGKTKPSASSPHFPLVLVTDSALPGAATRFDYQAIDPARGHLVVAHMRDDSVVVLRLSDGHVEKVLAGIPTPRGVAIGDDVGRVFVTSSPARLVIIDNQALTEIARVPTGASPDGVAYDPKDRVVGVSDQGDGAISLILAAGSGKRTQVRLGVETGNVVFDAGRGVFWITVVAPHGVGQLVELDPLTGAVKARIALPGCSGAHGLRLHPDGSSAFVACEDNSLLARVELEGSHALVTARTGADPDVLSLDPGLGFLYVAAESGELTVFDSGQPGLVVLDREHVGAHAHSVAVDPATHRVFFPLEAGPSGKPVLRSMRPK